MKKRLDQHLVDEGLAPSKTKAQEMIERGEVQVFSLENPKLNIQNLKPSKSIDPATIRVEILDGGLLKFVSRAGLKLESALEHIKLGVKGMRVLDVGQSTGGFTDCALQRGAAFVVGVDVAKDELAEKLRDRADVRCITGLNARDLKNSPDMKGELFDLILVDVSFISVEKVWPELYDFLKPKGALLSLVKPQFEFDRSALDKRGIIRDEKTLATLEPKIRHLAESIHLNVRDYFPSGVKGRDGNQEFFLYATK